MSSVSSSVKIRERIMNRKPVGPSIENPAPRRSARS